MFMQKCYWLSAVKLMDFMNFNGAFAGGEAPCKPITPALPSNETAVSRNFYLCPLKHF
jgi:hypothetical protein